jgi:hypothetical protein
MDDTGDNRRRDDDASPRADEGEASGNERRPGLGQPMTGAPSIAEVTEIQLATPRAAPT